MNGGGGGGGGGGDETGASAAGRDAGLDLLVACDVAGVLTVAVAGIFHIMTVDLTALTGPTAGNLVCYSSAFEEDMGTLSVWLASGPSSSSGGGAGGAGGTGGTHRLLQLDTEVLWKHRHEIEYVSTKATLIGALMARLTDSMVAVESQWLTSLAGLGSRLGELVRLLGDYGRSSSSPVEELLALLMHGGASVSGVHLFQTLLEILTKCLLSQPSPPSTTLTPLATLINNHRQPPSGGAHPVAR